MTNIMISHDFLSAAIGIADYSKWKPTNSMLVDKRKMPKDVLYRMPRSKLLEWVGKLYNKRKKKENQFTDPQVNIQQSQYYLV